MREDCCFILGERLLLLGRLDLDLLPESPSMEYGPGDLGLAGGGPDGRGESLAKESASRPMEPLRVSVG